MSADYKPSDGFRVANPDPSGTGRAPDDGSMSLPGWIDLAGECNLMIDDIIRLAQSEARPDMRLIILRAIDYLVEAREACIGAGGLDVESHRWHKREWAQAIWGVTYVEILASVQDLVWAEHERVTRQQEMERDG